MIDGFSDAVNCQRSEARIAKYNQASCDFFTRPLAESASHKIKYVKNNKTDNAAKGVIH